MAIWGCRGITPRVFVNALAACGCHFRADAVIPATKGAGNERKRGNDKSKSARLCARLS